MPHKIINVVGARPNYMKIAPLMEEMKKASSVFSPILVHTGQHYDKEMSHVFFKDLNMPKPDINLNVGSGSHAEQTAAIMIGFENILKGERPDVVVVAGDVNSTLACALVAKKLHIKVAHVESGLRSYDMHMPEEINRRLTDSISDYLFTPSLGAGDNLRHEGIEKEKIFFVGNIMIDTLFNCRKLAKKKDIPKNYGLAKKQYSVLTLHRPENVDNRSTFISVLDALAESSKKVPILFPVHPRTKQRIKSFKLEKYFKHIGDTVKSNEKNIFFLPPLGYIDFIGLLLNSRFVLTDSGGIQEESTILQIPCLTIRRNTERPITVKCGHNLITGSKTEDILKAVDKITRENNYRFKTPKYWDGKTAKRIVKVLKDV
ncbi:MAG: UDP-N-acetylglucosamine 2-epimerase (non-hydrolyzing) [Candidatus Omnitrophica bacterium]|nr:UDP-N-acetylglucosamine 2-epimerase (non-hydrolyzing) [Candidatus Omnitrophota bacterium]